MPAVKNVGEPCAGEPHARIDGRELETSSTTGYAPVPDPTGDLRLDLVGGLEVRQRLMPICSQ